MGLTLCRGCSLNVLPLIAPSPMGMHGEQHRCMGLNSHGVSKVSVIDAAGVKQVEHK